MDIKPVVFLLLHLFSGLSEGYKMAQISDDMTGVVSDLQCSGDISPTEPSGGQSCGIKTDGKSKVRASSIALKAAKEAKDASDAQLEAGEAAARQVKQQLAEKAQAAAKAAEAVLAGKQQVVEQLESEVREGELVVQEESTLLQTTQATCSAAGQAAKQATDQLKTISQALKNAQDKAANSEQVANGAQLELAEKQQLVDAAKKRVELLLRQLEVARTDFKSTKAAAEKAACAAQEARQRATRERRRAELRHLIRLKRGRTH
ncbi:plectin [Drosophila elegans]|uniref:plectin n=1 Tax=Drosophila elegans TaxID=30023 RepID=UPI0007E818F9|nr:plectin [Drosophila elegans]